MAEQPKARREERIAGVIMIIFSVAYTIGAFQIKAPALHAQVGPDVFPKVVGFLMILLSVIFTIQQVAGKIKEDAKRAEIIGADEKVESKADLKTMGAIVLLMIAYTALFVPLGYALTTFFAFVAGSWILDRKHMLRDSFIAAIAGFGLYMIFVHVLRVDLPPGPLALIGL